jgi:putative transposase
MNDRARFRPQVFDPKQEFSVVERRLPHWSQAAALSFITWRTWDSIPRPVLEEWLAERAAWLRQQGIEPGASDWQARLHLLAPNLLEEFRRRVADRWNEHLDDCHGACLLCQPALARIVGDSLLHFDRDRYELTDFVVMPNHVHVLVAFPDEGTMLGQCESWKRFTATKINLALGRKGRFWQQDGFDHLVRSPEQFAQLRGYIASNPSRAGLRAGEFLAWSKSM